jgi:hypothetical protein
MAKEIFRIENSEHRFEAHRCLYPTPRLFVFTHNKVTGERTAFEQSVNQPLHQTLPIAGRLPVMQQAMTETAQTTAIVWQHLSKLTAAANKPKQAPKPNPKKPESKKPASKIPKSDPFEKADKKRTTQRWN